MFTVCILGSYWAFFIMLFKVYPLLWLQS